MRSGGNMTPCTRTSRLLAPSCARRRSFRQRHRAPSSEAAPSLEVAAAVTDAGIAPGASTVSGQIAKGAEKK